MFKFVSDLYFCFDAFDDVLFELSFRLLISFFSWDLLRKIGTCLSSYTLEMTLQATCCEGLFLSHAEYTWL